MGVRLRRSAERGGHLSGRPVCGSGQVVLTGLDACGEVMPVSGSESEGGSAGVLGVADGDGAGVTGGDFYAVTTAVAAVAGLAPAPFYLVFHCSAASRMSIRDSSRGSASPRTRSKFSVA